jgi:hypothetical protein
MQTAHDSNEEALAENMRGHMYNSAPLRMDCVQDSSWSVRVLLLQVDKVETLPAFIVTAPEYARSDMCLSRYVVNRPAFCRIHTEGLT